MAESADAGVADTATPNDGEAPDGGLFAWALATFHVALLVAAGVTGLHLAGSLGDSLAGLGTATGAGLYLLLWATTWWTTGGWLAAAWPTPAGPVAGEERPDLDTRLVHAGGWGGANGTLFFLGLAAVVFGPNTLRAGAEALPVLAFLVLLGGLVAFAVGAIVGGLFALLDAGCWRAAGWLLAAERSGENPGDE